MKVLKYISFLLLFLFPACFPAQTSYVDSLQALLKTTAADSGKVKLLLDLGWEIQFYDPAKAKTHVEEALALSQKLNWKKGIGDSYSAYGNVHTMVGDFSAALLYHHKALEIREGIGDKKGIAGSYGNIGSVYIYLSDYPKALENQLKSLGYNEAIKNKTGIASTLGNLGNIAHYMGDYKKALEYNKKCLAINEELNNKIDIANALGNIGTAYHALKAYPEALAYHKKSLKLDEEINDQAGVAHALNNIANLYLAQSEAFSKQGAGDSAKFFLDLSLKHLRTSLRINETLKNSEGVALAYLNIGSVLMSQKKLKEAGDYLDKALFMSKEIGLKERMILIYRYKARLDSMQNNYTSALANYKFYIQYKDSLNSEENIKKNTMIQMEYDFGKRMAQDSLKNLVLMKESQLKREQEINQQKNYTYGGIGGFVMMLAAACLLIKGNMQKRKANELIARQKALVDEKQQEVLDSIRYARRIQQALLTSEKYIEKSLDLHYRKNNRG